MARVFAWLRPNDLIWNYWVNNYLLGNKPPAFDILYWNAYTTRLPAAFHADLLGIIESNPFVNAGAMAVLGKPIDMAEVDVEAYIVAGITDHITPWRPATNGAHLRRKRLRARQRRPPAEPAQPAGQAKSFFSAAKVGGPDPDAWASRRSAERRQLVAALDGLDAPALGRAGGGAEEARQPQAPAGRGGAG